MQVELYTKQFYEDHKEEETTIYEGQLKTALKGSILEFWNVETKYQMTILENKILLKKPNQTMIFEKDKKTKSELQTPYGVLSMNLTTTHMEIIGQNEQIQKIVLHYEIELDGTKPYQNQIEIKVK